MDLNVYRYLYTFIVIILLVFLLSACSSKGNEAKKPGSEEQKPKAPVATDKILDDIETIIAELDNKIKMERTSSVQKNTQLELKEKSQESQSQQKKSGEKEEQGSKKKSSSQEGSDWKKEEESLKRIHQNWNSMEAEAVQTGLNVEVRDSFEKDLNQLTENISRQEKVAGLLTAAELLMDYGKMTKVFNMPVPPAFFQLESGIITAITEAGQEKWKSAREEIKKAEENWDNLKVQAKDTDKKILDRTEFSIQDLKQAIENKKIDLTLLKGEIVINNLKKLEEKLSI